MKMGREIKVEAEDKKLGLSLDELREIVAETMDLPGALPIRATINVRGLVKTLEIKP